MAEKKDLIFDESEEAFRKPENNEISKKLPWYFANGFLLFWVLLFFAVVIPFFYRLPTALTVQDDNKNVFIAERAYKNLYTLSNIGTKLTGSKENEIEAVKFILSELNEIKRDLLEDYFDMEIDLSQASGMIALKSSQNVYQGVQNIAVKLSPKNSQSETYLLVNSHFDSKPATPSAGDAGFMIVTMLEVLRVIATTRQPIEHPIVFLFNGAEEGGLLAAHGFITQHKWAPFCKAVINLDAAGSGGREVLFQSGPNHSWLVKYYKNYVKHPFATTLAEEIFQSGIVPSDTDFRQFTTYGKIPGLDLAQAINGFVYHTKYDTIDVIPRESLQNTGDNILSLVRGLANATELHDTQAYKTGRAVFFDFLGLYFIHYTETAGMYLNFGVAGAALVLIFVSIWRMAAVSQVSILSVLFRFILVFIIQLIAFVLGLALPALVAYVFDACGLSLTYYSTAWLVIGLYICPSLIGLSLPSAVYYYFQRNDNIKINYHNQLALHSSAVILALFAIVITVLGFRFAYVSIIPLLFYAVSLALNLLTTLHDRGFTWTGLVTLGQVAPFLYSSYVFYFFFVALTPMQGRSGSSSNPDITIALIVAAGTVLSFGLVIPLINIFRRPSYVVFCLVVLSTFTMFLASSTQIGFPYRPQTNGLRVSYLHARNMFYDYDGTLIREESGYLFLYQDRREEKALQGSNVNLTGLVSIKPNCEQHMMCGMPLYDFRYVQHRLKSKWLPRSEPITLPSLPKLQLISKQVLNQTTVRFEFNLTGPSHMGLFFKTYEDVTITNWSFLRSVLGSTLETQLTYQVFFSYGIDSSPLNFFVELSKLDGVFHVPLFQMGVAAHYIKEKGDKQSEEFAATFPSYAILAEWPASYQRCIF